MAPANMLVSREAGSGCETQLGNEPLDGTSAVPSLPKEELAL